MVPRPNRIRAARMHLFTESPLSSCCRGRWNSSSFSSSSSALPIRSRSANRDLLLLSCGPTSPAAFCSPTSDATEESGVVTEQNMKNIILNSIYIYRHFKRLYCFAKTNNVSLHSNFCAGMIQIPQHTLKFPKCIYTCPTFWPDKIFF